MENSAPEAENSSDYCKAHVGFKKGTKARERGVTGAAYFDEEGCLLQNGKDVTSF